MEEKRSQMNNTWKTALWVCVRNAPEMVFHVLVQLLVRVPLYYLLYRMLRSYLSTGSLGPDTVWTAAGAAASFLLLVMPCRFMFGEILRRWSDEYMQGIKREKRLLCFEDSILNAVRRYPFYLLSGLKRVLFGAGAFPWVVMAVLVFFFYTDYAFHLEDFKKGDAIIGAIPMLIAGEELKPLEQLLYGALTMTAMIGCFILLSVIFWQRHHASEFRLQPSEGVASVGSLRHFWVMISNLALDIVSLLPAFLFTYDYARDHFKELYDVISRREYDKIFMQFDNIKSLLKEPLKDMDMLLPKLILCIILIYLPLRIYRRARAAAFISCENTRER